MVRAEKTERNKAIFLDRLSGMYYKTIAEKHGISVARVIQVIDDVERKDKVNLLDTTINYQGRHPEYLVDYLKEHGYKFDIHSGDLGEPLTFKIWGRSITPEIKVLNFDWNEFNKKNMEILDARRAKEAADD